MHTTLDFALAPDARGEYVVTLTIGGDHATAPFQFDHRPDSRISQVIRNLSEPGVTADQLRDVGTNLFIGLMNDHVAELFGRARDEFEQQARVDPDCDPFVLRLSLPAALQHLPWETLLDERRKGFLFTDPKYSLVRAVPDVSTPPVSTPPRMPLSMLVVIPEGSNLDADRELDLVRGALEHLGDAVDVEPLKGFVTPDALRARLDDQPWDIVHFIGHGVVSDGAAQIRLNDPDRNPEGLWMSGERFATFFTRHVPRLVVLNSCHGVSAVPGPALSGIAPFLVRQGVPAIIAMQFEVPDTVAISFARTLYSELLGPRARGRIDLAVGEARRVVFQNANYAPHSFVMPTLYRAEGFGVLFEPNVAAVHTIEPPAIITISPAITLPDELVAALSERKCIPVVSAEILRAGATRGTPAPPGPRELSFKLAGKLPPGGSPYPLMADFDDSCAAAPLPSDWPLQSVCQYFERSNRRYRLLEAVSDEYRGVQPPPGIEAIAALDVPGMIFTYFDGLIEDALTARRVRFRSLPGVTGSYPVSTGEDTIVVQLRGTAKQPATLVLTETDHEAMLEGMRDMSTDITELTRKDIGRSVLYIGLHPRDPIVRRLTPALRGSPEMQSRSAQGPLFFAYDGDTNVHEPYWSRYNVQWIRVTTEDLVGALARVVGPGAHR